MFELIKLNGDLYANHTNGIDSINGVDIPQDHKRMVPIAGWDGSKEVVLSIGTCGYIKSVTVTVK